jgi:subtilisin family serine protease
MVFEMRRLLSPLLILVLLPVAPLSASSVQTIDVAAIFESANGLELRRYEVPVTQSNGFVDGLSSYRPVLAAGVVNRRHTLADPRTGEQWGLARMDVDAVRKLGTGKDVIVAVVDTGVDALHPELAGRVLPGIDLVDDGKDGRTDPNGHGTHVAGIIAAAVDGNGIEGLAPEAKILPVRVLGNDGSGDDADVAFGILWAVRQGAQVINLSLGGTDIDPLLEDAVRQAHSAGVVVVAASGNSGGSGDIYYPAAHATVLAVGATGPDDKVALYSSVGSYVDIAAPGTMILSTWPGGYRYESGTSMATPFVAAAAAILIQAGYQNRVVEERLISSAYDIDVAGRDTGSGAGILDVVGALTGGLPRVEQPDGIRLPGLPSLPAPSVPNTPSLPGLPSLPTLPSLPPFPGDRKLPKLPDLPKPVLPTPTLPGMPDSLPPIRRTLAPVETYLTTKASFVSGKVRLSVALRTENFPLAYRKLTVTVYSSGSKKNIVTLRTTAEGNAMYDFPKSVKRLDVHWAGDLITRPTSNDVTPGA